MLALEERGSRRRRRFTGELTMSQIHKFFSKSNFNITDVPADGLCGFFAILCALRNSADGISQEDAFKFRELVADFMDDDKALYRKLTVRWYLLNYYSGCSASKQVIVGSCQADNTNSSTS